MTPYSSQQPSSRFDLIFKQDTESLSHQSHSWCHQNWESFKGRRLEWRILFCMTVHKKLTFQILTDQLKCEGLTCNRLPCQEFFQRHHVVPSKHLMDDTQRWVTCLLSMYAYAILTGSRKCDHISPVLFFSPLVYCFYQFLPFLSLFYCFYLSALFYFDL